jgi:hypothetical protein
MSDISEPKTLDDWIIWGHSVRGILASGKLIRTSWVHSRDGDVVTTKSGSRYKLLGIADWCVFSRQEMYDHIDKCIKGNGEDSIYE